jgi:hypothetical protein
MRFLPIDETNVAAFLRTIVGQQRAYQHGTFRYVAVKQGQEFVLIKGRVSLNTHPTAIPVSHFCSESVRAGCYRLSELKLDLNSLIERVAADFIDTPNGRLFFPSAPDGRYSTIFAPLHAEGLQFQSRLSVLTITGNQLDALRQPDLDWEIKAAPTPYDGLQELMSEYGVGPWAPDSSSNIEIVVSNVAAIDASKSTVSGDTATVEVLLAQTLIPAKFTLGYRIYKPGITALRSTVSGSSFNWSQEEMVQRGVITLKVPDASVINCISTYDGIAQSHYWLADPSKLQNMRRAA